MKTNWITRIPPAFMTLVHLPGPSFHQTRKQYSALSLLSTPYFPHFSALAVTEVFSKHAFLSPSQAGKASQLCSDHQTVLCWVPVQSLTCVHLHTLLDCAAEDLAAEDCATADEVAVPQNGGFDYAPENAKNELGRAGETQISRWALSNTWCFCCKKDWSTGGTQPKGPQTTRWNHRGQLLGGDQNIPWCQPANMTLPYCTG